MHCKSNYIFRSATDNLREAKYTYIESDSLAYLQNAYHKGLPEFSTFVTFDPLQSLITQSTFRYLPWEVILPKARTTDRSPVWYSSTEQPASTLRAQLRNPSLKLFTSRVVCWGQKSPSRPWWVEHVKALRVREDRNEATTSVQHWGACWLPVGDRSRGGWMGGVQVNGTSLTLGKAINYVYHAGRLGQTFCHTALCINACTCKM